MERFRRHPHALRQPVTTRGKKSAPPMEHVYFLEAAMHGVAGSMNSMNSKNSDEGFFPGKRLPGTKYRVVRIIGEGGMAVAYECVKEPAGIRCVVKVLRRHLSADREQCVRFLREVSFLAELVHPHIVTVIDYDTLSTGAPFYAMELLTGKTLRAVLEEQGTLPPRVALKVMTQLLSALHCAHTHSTPLVHRDVKPDNVFIHTPRHGESTVKLLDFGVATVAHRATVMAGTWGYMAPEQLVNKAVSAQTDIYAAAVILFELLTGAPPFATNDLDLLSRATLGMSAPRLSEVLPWIPRSVDDVVASALDKEPANRPASAEEFAARLSELARDDLVPVQSGATLRGPYELAPRTDASLTAIVKAADASAPVVPSRKPDALPPSDRVESFPQPAGIPSRSRDVMALIAIALTCVVLGSFVAFVIVRRGHESPEPTLSALATDAPIPSLSPSEAPLPSKALSSSEAPAPPMSASAAPSSSASTKASSPAPSAREPSVATRPHPRVSPAVSPDAGAASPGRFASDLVGN